MGKLVAALPMYDLAECRAETDAHWEALRDGLRASGVDAPDELVRSNAELPPVPGGICGKDGQLAVADPATLPSDELDVDALWRHPDLLLAQTCWGPLNGGLEPDVRVVAQPSYDGYEGGVGALYSSAIVMRRSEGVPAVAAPADGQATIPWTALEGRILGYNGAHSRSGIMALRDDFEAAGKSFPDLADCVCTGGHIRSVQAVAGGTIDFAAIDCRTWHLAQKYERASHELATVGWTRLRRGLPMITSLRRTGAEVQAVAAVLSQAGGYQVFV